MIIKEYVMVLIMTKTRFQIIKLQWPRGCRLFQLGQLFHYEYDFQLVLQKLNPQYFFLHEASLQLTNEHTGISGEKKLSVNIRQTITRLNEIYLNYFSTLCSFTYDKKR